MISIKRAKEIQLKEMESYLQQNANKVDAVAKEKEAGQNQKENRKVLKVRFIIQTRPPQDVDVLAVLDFQIPCFCPETPGFYP